MATPRRYRAARCAPGPALLTRRRFLHTAAAGAAALGLAACARDTGSAGAAPATGPLPTSVPPGTKLAIASGLGAQQLALELSGLDRGLPFTVTSWPNISAGPDVRQRHLPAVLLVTHDVDEAVALADRVLVLADGRLAVDAPVDVPHPRPARDPHPRRSPRPAAGRARGVGLTGRHEPRRRARR